MKNFIHWLIVLFWFSPLSSWGSPLIDDQYSYKGMAAAVLNTSKEPIYADQVEGQLITLLRNNGRFDFSDQGYVTLKEKLKAIAVPTVGEPTEDKYRFLTAPLRELYELGSKAVILGEVVHSDQGYQLHFALLTTMNGELIAQETVTVEQPKNLESFTAATKQAFPELLRKIPFDATVLKRDGYLIVFDRGTNVFKMGTQVPAYTLEKRNGKLLFEETGLIGITQVEENLAFGKILVERRPHEIATLNKVRLSEAPIADVAALLTRGGERGPSSLFENEFEITKGKLGVLDLDLSTSLLTLSNTKADGSEFSASKAFPSGNLQGELWLTSKYFVAGGFNYGMTSLVNKPTTAGSAASEDSSGLSISGFKFQVGYHLNLSAPHVGPVVYFKLGYGTQSFSIGTDREPLLFTSASYAGPMLSSGIHLPITDKIGVGLDIDTLVLASVSEKPVKNGAKTKNVSAWNFALKGSYNFKSDLDLVGKLYFQRYGAEFSGDSTRANKSDALASASEVTKGLMFGIAYYY